MIAMTRVKAVVNVPMEEAPLKEHSVNAARLVIVRINALTDLRKGGTKIKCVLAVELVIAKQSATRLNGGTKTKNRAKNARLI